MKRSWIEKIFKSLESIYCHKIAPRTNTKVRMTFYGNEKSHHSCLQGLLCIFITLINYTTFRLICDFNETSPREYI